MVKRDSLVKRDSFPTRDSLVKRDSAAARDTTPLVPLPVDTAKKKIPRDTIKAPIASAELPTLDDTTGSYHLTGADIFGSGARNVGDLLRRIPGITQLSTGWMAVPATAAYLGDAARVRVFLDGLEYTSLDPHAGGAIDYSQIPLWPIQDVTVERSASEVRVYLNTWTVNRTTPYTRTDISTGDFQTNMYRGLFGRRFNGGELLQFGVQQYGTAPGRGGATSDQLSLMGRLGWARGKFSVDAFLMQVGSHRGGFADPVSGDSLATLQAARRDAYVRLGYGSSAHGPWLQAMAATTRYAFGSGASTLTAVPKDSTAQGDTTVSGAQYVLTGGLTRWGIRLSGAGHYFASFDRGNPHAPTVLADSADSAAVVCCHKHGLFVPSIRASYNWWGLGFSAFAEGKGIDSTSRREVNAMFTPLSFVRFSGSMGSVRDSRVVDSLLSPSYRRLEAGIRVHDLWLGGGIITRGAVSLATPTLVKDSLQRSQDGSASAKFVSLQGRLYKGIHADAFALRWDDSTGFYRPQYEARSQLYISTSLLNRFPDNSFHIFVALAHDYRSATYFPMGNSGVTRVAGYRTVGATLEIRIERAVLSYQFSNVLGEKYNQVPGFLMPRQSSIYGIRWEFWN